MCCRHSVSPSKQITPFLEARDSWFSGVRLWGGHRPNPPAVVAMGSWQEYAFTMGDVSVSVSDTDFIENNDFLQNPVEKRTLLRPFLGPVFICISAREAAGGKGACSGIMRGLRWEEWLGARRGRKGGRMQDRASASVLVPTAAPAGPFQSLSSAAGGRRGWAWA